MDIKEKVELLFKKIQEIIEFQNSLMKEEGEKLDKYLSINSKAVMILTKDKIENSVISTFGALGDVLLLNQVSFYRILDAIIDDLNSDPTKLKNILEEVICDRYLDIHKKIKEKHGQIAAQFFKDAIMKAAIILSDK